MQKKLLKHDEELLQKSSYDIIDGKDISSKDIKRLVELYNMLYLDKYSKLNVQFNEHFMQELAIDSNYLNIKALRNKEGRIDAILGYFIRNETITTPVFGYDTTLSVKDYPLYRLLSIILVQEARKHKSLLNQSSGAGEFKRIRGSKNSFEYTAVYCSHLPLYQQFPFLFLKLLITSIAIPMIQQYKL